MSFPQGVAYNPNNHYLYYSERVSSSPLTSTLKKLNAVIGVGQTAPVSGEVDPLSIEAKLFAISQTSGTHTAGRVYFGTGTPGGIGRLIPSSDPNVPEITEVATIPWAILPGEDGQVLGFGRDQSGGVLAGDLVVVTSRGGVWRINGSGGSTLIARVPQLPGQAAGYALLEACLVVPNNSGLYGLCAGKILVGADSRDNNAPFNSSGLWLIDPALPVATRVRALAATPVEDLDLIESGKDFLLADFGSQKILNCPASDFTAEANRILIIAENCDQSGAIPQLRILNPMIVGTTMLDPDTQLTAVDGLPCTTLEHGTFVAPGALATTPFPTEPSTTGPNVFKISAVVPSIGEEEVGSGVFAIHRSGSTTCTATVNYSLPPGAGRAEYNVDYLTSVPPGSVFFDTGVSTVFIKVTPIDDTRYEGNEAVVATLFSPTAGAGCGPASLGQASATVTITEADQYQYIYPGSWTLVDLGPSVDPTIQCTATGINNRKFGETSFPQVIGNIFNQNQWRAARADNNQLGLLPTSGVLWSIPRGIAENGWVVGDYYPNGNVCSCAFFWDGLTSTITTIPVISGDPTSPLSAGQTRVDDLELIPLADNAFNISAVGFGYLQNVPGNPQNVQRALVWTRDSGNWTAMSVGTLDGSGLQASSISYATSINQALRITGSSTTLGSAGLRAFRTFLQESVIRPQEDNLGTLSDPALGASWSEGVEINDVGEVVGHSSTPAGKIHIFVKRKAYIGNENPPLVHNGDRPMVELAASSGLSFRARGINNLGNVVAQAGVTGTFIGDPVLFPNDGSGPIYLFSLPPSSSMVGWQLQEVYDINNSNRIVGSGLRNGIKRGFMLVPTYPN